MSTTDPASRAPATSSLPRLGVDVSKATFDVCLCLPGGARHAGQFANTAPGFLQLDAWLKSHALHQVSAALEATGPYGLLLLRHLHNQGHTVYQLNPRRVKDFARSQGRRVKTDRVDAAIIADFLQAHAPLLKAWQPPAQALVELQALVRRRAQLLDMCQAERNRQEGGVAKVIAASLQRQIRQMQAEIKKLDAAIDAHVLAHAALQHKARLLRSIPGVGRVVAVTILAEVPAISAFERARDVAAFTGLTPALAESGTSVRRRGGMTREGSALLRKALYMAALQTVKRTNNAFHGCFHALVQRGKAKKTALVAIMHKIIRVAFGVLKHDTAFAANLASC